MSDDDRDQRTLPPSPKRLEEFRKRGESVRSRDVVVAATLLGGLAATAIWAPMIARTLTHLVRDTIVSTAAPSPQLAGRLLSDTLLCAAPAGLGAMAGYAASVVPQLGWPPALKPLGFDVGKVFGGAGFARLFSIKAASGRALVSTLKVAFVGLAAGWAGKVELDRMLLPGHGMVLAEVLGRAVVRIVTWTGVALAALAAADYLWQRRELMARMRMTPQEAKREHREQEGSPELKRKRKQRQREMAKQRHEVTVRAADVVVVNPTHYAVALRYTSGKDASPRVVAKGKDLVAQRIRKLARQWGVPVVHEPPLARALHRLVPEGKEIPRDLFHAVAEVLAYVYRLQKRRGA